MVARWLAAVFAVLSFAAIGCYGGSAVIDADPGSSGTVSPQAPVEPLNDAGVQPADDVNLAVDGGSSTGPLLPPPGSKPAPKVGSLNPCGNTGAPFETGSQFRTLDSAGGLRWYYVYVPKSYSPTKKHELVVNIHGYTSDPLQQALLSGMNSSADDRDFIVVYPAGVNHSWNAGQCCGDTAWLTHVDDVQFISDLIDSVSREYCVDQKKVFATGMSNGGFLSHRLACDLSDKIAAVAPVAGVVGIPDCEPKRHVPVMHFHGTLDPLVPYYGGSPVGFSSVPYSTAGWRVRNGCGLIEQTTYENGDASCVTWSGCSSGDQETQLCTIDGGGHTWPGGFPVPPLGWTSYDLDATKMMLDFFDRHPMP